MLSAERTRTPLLERKPGLKILEGQRPKARLVSVPGESRQATLDRLRRERLRRGGVYVLAVVALASLGSLIGWGIALAQAVGS